MSEKKDKGYWYLSGFKSYGFKYWLLSNLAKVLLFFRLISDEDAKRFANTLINAYFVEQAQKGNFKVEIVEFGGDNVQTHIKRDK